MNVKKCAAKALSIIGDVRAVVPLIDALEDNNRDVREYAAKALGKIGDIRAVEPLIVALKDNNEFVRKYAAEALGKIGDVRAIEPLIVVLIQGDRFDRLDAVEALDNLNWEPQTDYQKAIYLITKWQWQECVKMGVEAVEPLIVVLKENDKYVRKNAAETLGKIGDVRAVGPLINTLEDNNKDVRENVLVALSRIGDVRAIEPLIDALEDNNEDIRMYAAEALGKMGDVRAIPGLVFALRDWYTGRKAADALNKLGWKPVSINDSIHLLVVEKNGYQLKQIWEDTRRVLLDDATSDNYDVIRNALFAFICIGKQEIIPELIKILNTKGTKTTALVYLNCRNEELFIAAKSWASKHGYIIDYTVGSSTVSWGEW